MLALVGFVGLCLLVGAADAAIGSVGIRHWYPSLTPPPGTPPNWVFGPVWSALYVLMGIAGWLVWRRCGASRPLRLWGWQLAANAVWTPFFFGLHNPVLALADMVVLIGLLGATIRGFHRVQPAAAGLLLPYLLWTFYAAYLNAGFWWLNRF
ncbi:MAG TPA: TspO/MBR family protein [Acetobacteraceae bacterium]|nr:TspO/MBR family protein [Acetobacteraceae bacterium]